ncbi:hypothetical protein [Burkholderia pseudomallei]|uniref:hypothetical protein n=1 Tax=Burkholderia pseudomallei TaxID=28450 RepID=UPI001060CC08|nr:hypothetical protein [Burkholderia pseudomallei]
MGILYLDWGKPRRSRAEQYQETSECGNGSRGAAKQSGAAFHSYANVLPGRARRAGDDVVVSVSRTIPVFSFFFVSERNADPGRDAGLGGATTGRLDVTGAANAPRQSKAEKESCGAILQSADFFQSSTSTGNNMSELTVGDLKRQLEELGDDVKISFAGGLTFYRLKRWGDEEFIVEFNEAEGYLTEDFKKRNPSVQVVFIGTGAVDWDADGRVGQVDVSVT